MPAEPLPSPVSKLPKPGDFYGAGNIPTPVDTDLTIALVWHPHKLGPNNGGWVTVQIPFSSITDLPVSTLEAIGLMDRAQQALGGALAAMGQTEKTRRRTSTIADMVQQMLSAAASWAGMSERWGQRSKGSANLSQSSSYLSAGMSFMAQQKVNAARRTFSDSYVAMLVESMARSVPPRVPRATDSNHVIAQTVFGP